MLLPGLGDAPGDHEARRIIAEIHRTNPRFDVITADAHYGYCRTRTLLERRDKDATDPEGTPKLHLGFAPKTDGTSPANSRPKCCRPISL